MANDLAELRAELVTQLEAGRNDDGSFGWQGGQPGEPEPTALASMALNDSRSADWLVRAQHDDGGFYLHGAPVEDSATTALVALALPAGDARRRAVDYALDRSGMQNPDDDDEVIGWGWTPTTYGWVEPTARVLLVSRLLRPDAPAVASAFAVLEDREIADGGWNYGNNIARGTDRQPYVQPSAAALLALAGVGNELEDRARRFIEDNAVLEPGGLSLAMAISALRAAGSGSGLAELEGLLLQRWESSGFLANLGVMSWALLAIDGPRPLMVGS